MEIAVHTCTYFLIISCRVFLPLVRITAYDEGARAAVRIPYSANSRAKFDEGLIHIARAIALFDHGSCTGPEDIQGRLGFWRRMKSEHST